jgi:hypothetical protein
VKRARPVSSRAAGYTMLELAIVALLIAMMLGSLALFGGRSSDAMSASAAQSDLDANLRRTVMRITEELLPSGFGVITVDAGDGDTIAFRKSDGVASGAIRWTTDQRLAFVHEPGELDDGLDNDGDGLVDEGVVVLTRNVGQTDEQSVVLCRGVRELGPGEAANGVDDDGDGLVDEHGLVLQQVGAALRVSLTLERLDGEGRVLTRTLETTIQPRN